ncbi:hypothetical protein PRZ48_008884 [Zasmidium cellare]|uniref:Uncharacterized protein n=1 Tax=Zasmidium cellare TaxID=395010 RepID=A0ABR0EHE5_ZASCE|nr:hypothetical protein PRZ48_008884 [Zasmidium cellare]
MADNLLHLAEVENQLQLARIDAVRQRALNIPEICSAVMEHLYEFDIYEAVQAGNPFYDTVRGSAILSKDMGFEYEDPSYPWMRVGPMFWDSMSCGCPRRSGCSHACYEALPTADGDQAYEIPPMVVDFSKDATPKEVRFSNEQALVKAMGSRGVFLDLRLGARPDTFKLVVQNMDENEEYLALPDQWRAPPIALKWVTAELLIDTTNLRMYGIYRIAKSLYECASQIDEKMIKGEAFDWDEVTGAVTDSNWKSFFHESDLQAVVSDGGPKYFWFWARDGLHPLWHGSSYTEHRDYQNRGRGETGMP